MTKKRHIGDMLLEAHLVDEAQLALALETHRQTGRKLGSALVDLRIVDENVLAAFLSKQIDVPCVSLLNVEIAPHVLRRIPAVLAHQIGAVPVALEHDAIQCAMIDPTDLDHVDALERATGLRIDPLVAPESSIRRVLARYYPLGDDGLPAEAPAGDDPFLFPELAEELERVPKVHDRLAALEEEVRALRGRIEELIAELRLPRR